MLIFEHQEKTDYVKFKNESDIIYKRGRFMHRLRITVCTTSSLIAAKINLVCHEDLIFMQQMLSHWTIIAQSQSYYLFFVYFLLLFN